MASPWPWTFALLAAGNQPASDIDDNFNVSILTVQTLTALKALAKPALPQIVLMAGGTSIGDGGWAIFWWNNSDARADNGFTIIQPTAGGTGRWNMLQPSLQWAVADGTADALTGAFTPPVTLLYDGLLLGVRAASANATATPTFQADATTAHTITKKGGAALLASDIAGNFTEILLRYNLANARWELLNPSTATPQFVNQNANTVLAGPVSGAAAGPTFRLLTGADGATEVTLGTLTANNSGTLDFTSSNFPSAFDGTYDQIIFDVVGIRPATDAVIFQALLGTGAGPTWHSLATDYEDSGNKSDPVTPSNIPFGATNRAYISLSGEANIGNASTKPINGTVHLNHPNNAAFFKHLGFDFTQVNSAGNSQRLTGQGRYLASTAITGVRFQFGTGNIAEGSIHIRAKRGS